MKKIASILFALILFASCQPGPKPIEFGFDACHYCKMTIVDSKHAAEYVTEKGKVFKFDAIECMLMDMAQKDESRKVAMKLVCTMDFPGELKTAETCTYLISTALPSPMGGFLSAFENENRANSATDLPDDQILNWSKLNEVFRSGAIGFIGQR